MKIVYPNSLAVTVDALNEAFFFERPLSKSQREKTARWIASRQGLPRSYRGLFAPTERDYRDGMRTFTGESIRSGAATGHVLGEEASRALILLDVPTTGVLNALERANSGFERVVKRLERERYTPKGMYCCGTCSVAFWRNLSVGGLEGSETRLRAGMKALKSYRDGSGRWRRFPFYYTLLALNELEIPSAIEEMRYAAPILKRILRRKPKRDKFSKRRRVLAERVLDKC